MTKIKRILTLIICVAILLSATVIGTSTASASGSGAGLVSWAYRAYNEHWKYVWGGASVGSVDCSGLIYSYAGGERVTESMIAASPESGSIGSIPRIHGLGLYQYGHVGVYVGGGMGIDARDEISNVCLDSISNKSWTQWFKISGVSYPTSGWQEVAGQYYYYEDGQYIVNTSRTIDGVTYSFGSDGASDKTPSNMDSTANSSTSNKNNNKKKKTAWQLGDSGSQVTKIQKRLKELGFYNGDITGYFGTDTEKAYKAFQTAAGVVVDGICGKTDRDILYSDNAPVYVAPTTVAKKKTTVKKTTKKTTKKTVKKETVISVGDYSDDVTSIQNQLIRLHYLDKGMATGYFGEDTEQAVKDFQDYNEITVTGSVDTATKKAMFSEDAVANPEYKAEEKKTEDNSEEKQLATFTFKEATEEPTTIAEPISTTDETTNKSVVLESNQLASKALAGVASSESFEQVTPITKESSSQLIKWLCVVIAVMGSVFVLVTLNEKKKARRRRRMRHARRNR